MVVVTSNKWESEEVCAPGSFPGLARVISGRMTPKRESGRRSSSSWLVAAVVVAAVARGGGGGGVVVVVVVVAAGAARRPLWDEVTAQTWSRMWGMGVS